MKTRIIITLMLLFFLGYEVETSQAQKTPDDGKEFTILLVDDHYVLYLSGTKRVLHPPKRNPSNPVIAEDKPWEGSIGWNSIYRDPKTGKYQLELSRIC